MNANERLSQRAIEEIRRSILDARGNEVFFVGSIGSHGKVDEITAAARGNGISVPVLRTYSDEGDVVIHNHPSGALEPSQADLAVAARLGNQGIGFIITDNQAEHLYVVAEPTPLRQRRPLETESLAEGLLPGGRLAHIFSGYEERPTQVEMLRLVCRSFNQDRLCIAEAGTGVGKSLAYLIPAIDWACRNEERVVVSTATINLQQQLLEKDIPLAMRVLGESPKTVLVKGRGNYVCLDRLQEALSEGTFLGEQDGELDAIYRWSHTTKTGSRSDLSFFPLDQVWARVRSESDLCHGLRCRYRERCFVLASRREAASASVLIVNHHLLFSDLEVRLSGLGFEGTAVLPPFRRIIFDEAHNIEASATSFFSESFSRFSVRKYINRLYRRRKGREFGQLMVLRRMLAGRREEKIDALKSLSESCIEAVDIVDHFSSSFFDAERSLLLKELEDQRRRSFFEGPLNDLGASMARIVHALDEFLDSFEDDETVEDAVLEGRSTSRRLRGVAALISRIPRFDEAPESIFWMARERGYTGEPYTRFVITPMDIAPLMQEAIYDCYPSVLFTSATLTVSGSFDFWKARVGLDRECLQESFASPFDYKENVLLGIPMDAPAPDGPEYRAYINSFVARTLKISQGRALVLFTSYSMLNETFESVVPELEELGIPAFKQGDDDRSRLLTKFRDDTASVLFATDSFWEGVDTPGEALEVLILCRLPFRVPSDPVLKARTEDIRNRGGNPFVELALPDAVIKLKQGFGRLMRRRSDGGIILILDSRIVRKSYGGSFLGSLPDSTVRILEGWYLMEEVTDFLAKLKTKRVEG
jgi:ATP-dependent DNA helicase DinG